MKKLILTSGLIVLLAMVATAQRYAFVDSEYILQNLPEYQTAKQEIDGLSEKWQKTIEAKYAAVDKLYKGYQAEKILLTEDLRAKKEQEIVEKEKEAKEYQRQKFGVEGELFKKRQELIKPIQDKIYAEIEKIAVSKSYAVIFDKASSASNILYADPKYDKSDEVLRKLGIDSQSE